MIFILNGELVSLHKDVPSEDIGGQYVEIPDNNPVGFSTYAVRYLRYSMESEGLSDFDRSTAVNFPDHLCRAQPAFKNCETRFSLEPEASHLAVPLAPRHERQCRTGS